MKNIFHVLLKFAILPHVSNVVLSVCVISFSASTEAYKKIDINERTTRIYFDTILFFKLAPIYSANTSEIIVNFKFYDFQILFEICIM